MPAYDYRCRQCGTAFELVYKSYTDYDAAAAQRVCPQCGSAALDRIIQRVTVQPGGKTGRDFASMNSGEMLNVLEGGDPGEVAALYQQTGADKAISDPALKPLIEQAVSPAVSPAVKPSSTD